MLLLDGAVYSALVVPMILVKMLDVSLSVPRGVLIVKPGDDVGIVVRTCVTVVYTAVKCQTVNNLHRSLPRTYPSGSSEAGTKS